MKSIRVNIAHYNEDLSWLQSLQELKCELLIYEKNTNLKYYRDYVKLNDNQIALCNIGREAHTYLTHIVHHYDDLRDYEVFLQGRVDDHINGSIMAHLKEMYEKEMKHISWCSPEKTKIGCYNDEVYQSIRTQYPDHKHINQFYPPYGTRDYLLFKEIFPDLEYPSVPYFFNSFALFGVKKEVIHFYSKSFYERLLNYFNPKYINFLNISTDEFIICMGYGFEVLWDFIFKHAVNELNKNI